MLMLSNLDQIGLWILYIILPIIAIYLAYLVLTKAFRYLGFSSTESLILILITILLGFPIQIFGFNISNVELFNYNGWIVGISTAGGLIPIVLSIYLIIKNHIPLKELIFGVSAVSIAAFLVTSPDPHRGIVSHFPFWILPAFVACFASVFVFRKNFSKGATLAYASGIFGVLIGADFFHLPELLNYEPTRIGTRAVIGGAIMLDMIFITGVLAVILYGLLMFRYRLKT